jgi:uncharacterized membrane protein
MPAVEDSIIINRSRSDVFAFATDPKNVPLFSSNLIEFEQITEGPVGTGTRNRGSVKVAGRRIDFVTEVVEFEEGEMMASRSIESPVPFELKITYEDAEGGTKVSWHQESPGFKGFFGKLADPLVNRMYAKDVRSNLEKLQDILESD